MPGDKTHQGESTGKIADFLEATIDVETVVRFHMV
jgi:hypothetical protein